MAAVETGLTFNYYVEYFPQSDRDLSAAHRAVDDAIKRNFSSYEPRLLNEDLNVPPNERIWVVRNCIVVSHHTEDHSQYDLSLIAMQGKLLLLELREKLPPAVAGALRKGYHGDDIWDFNYPLDELAKRISPSALRAMDMVFDKT